MMMMMYFCSLSYSSFFLSTFVAPFFRFLFCVIILHRYIVRSDCLTLCCVCLMLAFLHFYHALYFLYVLFYVILWRGDHPFLCIVFPIFLSLFVVSYWNLLFWFSSGALSVLSHQSCKTMELMCSATKNVSERRKCRVCLLTECPCGLYWSCCWVRCIVQCLRAFCSPFFLHTCLAVLFCLIFTTVLYVVGRLAE